MTIEQHISQRDLRLRSREIMDAVEHGESFTVTRDGREIGELVPRRVTRTFVSREEMAVLGRGLPHIDADRFRADLDSLAEQIADDPFAR